MQLMGVIQMPFFFQPFSSQAIRPSTAKASAFFAPPSHWCCTIYYPMLLHLFSPFLHMLTTYNFWQVIALSYACYLKADEPKVTDSSGENIEAPLLA
jgi:hypothetical protein